MTVSAQTSYNSSTGNGVTTVFPYTFKIISAADLEVSVDGVVKTLNSDYTVSGAGDDAGGNVTFVTAPSNPSTVVRRRNMAFARSVDYQTQGDLRSDVLNPDQDAPILMIQQLDEQVGRAIKVPVGESEMSELPAAAERAGMFLAFDAEGDIVLSDAGSGTDSGLRTDLAANSGSSLVGFLQSGTGAVARSMQSRLRDLVSVMDFGAVGDGVADDTAAIQAAVTAQNAGGTLYFPTGTYKVTSAISIIGGYRRIIGGMALIRTTSATANIFTVQGNHIGIDGLRFDSTVTRTGGYYIELNSSNFCSISNVLMEAPYRGVGITGTAGSGLLISESVIRGMPSTSNAGVYVSSSVNGVDIVLSKLLITGQGSGSQPVGGVVIVNAGDITLDHVSTVWAGYGLLVNPGAGQSVQLLTLDQCEFDSGNVAGIYLNADGAAAAIMAVRMSNTWSCSNGNCGLLISTVGAGVVQDVGVHNCILSNNTNYGALINTARVSNVRIGGTAMSANSVAGFGTAVNATRFSVKHCTIGACGQFLGNPHGIVIGDGSDNFEITDNDLSNNTTGPMFNATTVTLPGTPGQTYFIARNIGLVTYGASVQTLTAAATTTTVTHGLAATPRAQDISLTPRSGWGTAAKWWVNNPTATTFDIVTDANPGVGVLIAWQARQWGA